MNKKKVIKISFLIMLGILGCENSNQCSYLIDEQKIITLIHPYINEEYIKKSIKRDLKNKIGNGIYDRDFIYIGETGIIKLGYLERNNEVYFLKNKNSCNLELVIIPFSYRYDIYVKKKEGFDYKNGSTVSFKDFKKPYFINNYPFQKKISKLVLSYSKEQRVRILQLLLSDLFGSYVDIHENRDYYYEDLDVSRSTKDFLSSKKCEEMLSFKDKHNIMLFFYWDSETNLLNFVTAPTTNTSYFYEI